MFEIKTHRFIISMTPGETHLRLEIFDQYGSLADPQDTGLPADLSEASARKALKMLSRRLDMAAGRHELLNGGIDELLLIRASRAGAIILPRAARKVPAREAHGWWADDHSSVVFKVPRLHGSGVMGGERPR